MLHTIKRTLQDGWYSVRSKKTAADGSAPAVTALKASDTSSYTVFTIPESCNLLELAYLTNADAKTGTANHYFRRKDGDWCLFFIADFVGGTQTTGTLYDSTTTGYYADTISVTTDVAPKSETVIDGDAANRMARILIDPCGAYQVMVYWTAMSATTSWTVIGSVL
jgi:hypothetical protein